MTVHHPSERMHRLLHRTAAPGRHAPAAPHASATGSRAGEPVVLSGTVGGLAAVLRIGYGLVFLWAFADKLLALGYATGRAEDGSVDRFGDAAWVNGGSPTEGFLTGAADGPFADAYRSIAGAAWADWLFMAGLLGIGLALTLGAGVRVAAVTGAVLYVLMWSVVLPPVNHPVLDAHLLSAVTLLLLAALDAGRPWGLGGWWSRTSAVRRYPALR